MLLPGPGVKTCWILSVCLYWCLQGKCWDDGITGQKEPGPLSCPEELPNSQPTSNGTQMHPCCLTPSPSKTFRIKSFFTFQIASDFECLYRLNWLDLSNSINPICCKNLKLGYCISSFFFDQKHDPKFSPSPCKSSSKPLGQTADLCRVACSVAMSSRWNSAQGSGMCLAFSIACFQASCRRQRER